MSNKPSTMRAACWNIEQGRVVIEDKPIPEPIFNEFLIRIASASLCHSDLMAIGRTSSVTMGHEAAGYIEKIPDSLQDKGFREGDPVGFLYAAGACYECKGCEKFNPACEKGAKTHGFNTDGFFAEYAAVDWRNCVRLPASIDPRRASPIFCAGLTSFNAVDSCQLQPGQWLAVVGAGGLGQLATQIAKAMGIKVVAIDINDDTLDVCKRQGADVTFNSRINANYIDELKKITDGGVHAACVFSAANAAYNGTPPIIRMGGLLMVVGIPMKPLEFSALDLVLGKYRIQSENTGVPARMQKGVDFFAKHDIAPEVQVRKLEELSDMVTELQNGTATKKMLVEF